MKDNPYSKLIEQMKKQGKSVNAPSIQIGRVLSTNPLMVRIGDLQIDRANILIADYLLSGYSRRASLSNTASGNTGYTTIEEHGNHRHNISSLDIGLGTITFAEALKTNDRVAILPTSDRQTYIIIAKVVRP